MNNIYNLLFKNLTALTYVKIEYEKNIKYYYINIPMKYTYITKVKNSKQSFNIIILHKVLDDLYKMIGKEYPNPIGSGIIHFT